MTIIDFIWKIAGVEWETLTSLGLGEDCQAIYAWLVFVCLCASASPYFYQYFLLAVHSPGKTTRWALAVDITQSKEPVPSVPKSDPFITLHQGKGKKEREKKQKNLACHQSSILSPPGRKNALRYNKQTGLPPGSPHGPLPRRRSLPPSPSLPPHRHPHSVQAPQTDRVLFFWHAYDALTHLIIEGCFLYNCFFISTEIPAVTAQHLPGPHFLDQPQRLYGAAYGTGPTSRLWQEYGKADSRWLGADLGVVSLELLTVLLGGPAAVYICYALYKSSSAASSSSSSSDAAVQTAKYRFKMWFVAIGLAVAELYGGFMTFAPEWLSGSHALDTSDPMYLWLYLVFFNVLWVFLPIWVLKQGWVEVKAQFVGAALAGGKRGASKKDL
ncbi:EBP domain-containing protein [Histoplasma capsulatum H143]|uniref:EBP domain-containing protein n=1 Tax=Ajellomyces capsulatus (strain H143) TaxID=544712 RepID=C6HK27_AJECH|nr:EBP domain-containing protein [Histoplasma capsulatum H143]